MRRRLRSALAMFGVGVVGGLAACGDDGAVVPDAGVDAASDGAVTPPVDGGALPDAGAGIAAKHPGDVGIASDPDVIFFDDFESYGAATELTKKWDNYFQQSQTKIVTTAANVKAGKQALEFALPQQNVELSNAVQKILTTELDVLYLRWYAKLEKNFDVTGSSHNGGGISGHYFQGNNATPGVPADGKNKFLIEYECWRGQTSDKSPGALNVYIYHPEQRSNYGDHFFPTGVVLPNSSQPGNFGSAFVPRPDVTPDLDRWYAYEVMLKLNTPGQRDGRVTLWLDGQVVADFTNLRLRDIDTLKIDRFNVGLHAGSNPSGLTHKWVDNVVAAKSYIGPIAP